MSTYAIVLLVVGLLFLLLAAKTPVALALLAAAAAGLILQDGFHLAGDALGRLPFDGASKYTLIIVPLYITMGVFVRYSGGAEEIFRFTARYLRAIPGGLGVATISACAAFAAVSGSSVATIATIGQLTIREMTKYGYSLQVAAGIVGSAGTLGILIPPSIALVIYGVLTGESIGRLLIGGVIPGILTACVYALSIVIRARLQPASFGHGQNVDDTEFKRHVRPVPVLQMASIFAVIILGIQFGFFTVVESAAIACGLALLYFFANSFRKAGVLKDFFDAMGEAVSLNAMTFALLIGAGVFSYFLVSAGVPSDLTAWILGLDAPPWLVVALLLVAFIPLGMFLDGVSMLLIGVPLAYPVIDGLGFNGIWFGILVIKMIEIGLITPPFGMNAFVISGMNKEISIPTAFRGLMWFIPFELATVALIFAFPSIVTFLPELMRGK